MPITGLYPAIGMRSENEEVRVAMDLSWETQDDVSMSVDNMEEEWLRLHDVRLNGQVRDVMTCLKLWANMILLLSSVH